VRQSHKSKGSSPVDLNKHAQTLRLEAAKLRREQAMAFAMGVTRPRSAPANTVRKSTRAELERAAFHRVEPVPHFDRYDPTSIAREAAQLHERSMTSTHQLRLFRVSSAVLSQGSG